MRRFGTQGRVYPEDHYVVPRTAEVADFINREGQTGRGKIDLAIFHNAEKYIVETKIWEGPGPIRLVKDSLRRISNWKVPLRGTMWYLIIVSSQNHGQKQRR